VKLRIEHPDPVRVREALAVIGVQLNVTRADACRLVAMITSTEGDVELR
jgi:hypothetical protein